MKWCELHEVPVSGPLFLSVRCFYRPGIRYEAAQKFDLIKNGIDEPVLAALKDVRSGDPLDYGASEVVIWVGNQHQPASHMANRIPAQTAFPEVVGSIPAATHLSKQIISQRKRIFRTDFVARCAG